MAEPYDSTLEDLELMSLEIAATVDAILSIPDKSDKADNDISRPKK